jgi:hypothetical protein
MKPGAAPRIAVGLLCASVSAERVQAQDAAFGCSGPLCVAASAPAWSGIPYCAPLIQTLFPHLANGGDSNCTTSYSTTARDAPRSLRRRYQHGEPAPDASPFLCRVT